MVTFRISELRQAVGFARTARDRLRAGKLADALRYQSYAVHALGFVRTDAVRATSCTATLNRSVSELGYAIESAIRVATAPRRPADDASLIDLLAEGIRVLKTRDAVELTEEQIIERARNLTTSLVGEYEVFERD